MAETAQILIQNNIMKSKINRVLLIIMNDGTRLSYSVPDDRKPEVLFSDVINADGINKEDIKTNYFFPNTSYSVSDYADYFNEETKRIDEKPLSMRFKIEEFRRHRQAFFSVLDLEFMKSLEEGHGESSSHLARIKNYLRDLPEKIESYCENLTVEEIVKFNAFNNIFDIAIINGGSGYAKPPIVSIDAPNGPNMSGFQAKAVASIKNGSVSEIAVVQIGSGYGTTPAVSVSAPDNETGEVAVAVTHAPENNIHSIREMLNKIKDRS